jgi:hypothetical protein
MQNREQSDIKSLREMKLHNMTYLLGKSYSLIISLKNKLEIYYKLDKEFIDSIDLLESQIVDLIYLNDNE